MDYYYKMSPGYEVDKKIADKVCEELKKKYDTDFLVRRIGDRLNRKTARLYVSPADNSNLVFTAHIEQDSNIVTDDYTAVIAEKKLENEIIAGISKAESNVFARIFIPNQADYELKKREYTAAELINECGRNGFLMQLLAESSFDMDAFFTAAKEVCAVNAVSLAGSVYILSGEKFSECLKSSGDLPHPSFTEIEKIGPAKRMDFTADKDSAKLVSEESFSNREGV
ncbi:MAG: hypothetical protein MJ131_03010 [Lachnospiraceae bacterium]|nr:hypothetical protein [Lachnospiraceae bacterium]